MSVAMIKNFTFTATGGRTANVSKTIKEKQTMKAMVKLILAAFAATAICHGAHAGAKDWMVVNLKTGDVSYYGYDFDTATNTFNTVEYKTEKMAFRRIEAGDSYYVQNGAYTAQMEKPYYIGIFPVTRAQCNLMDDPNGAYAETYHYLRADGQLKRRPPRPRSSSRSSSGSDGARIPPRRKRGLSKK